MLCFWHFDLDLFLEDLSFLVFIKKKSLGVLFLVIGSSEPWLGRP